MKMIDKDAVERYRDDRPMMMLRDMVSFLGI